MPTFFFPIQTFLFLLFLLLLATSFCAVAMRPEMTCDGDLSSTPISCCSKREYLLAQIRQKNGIIEALLKQVTHTASIYHLRT